MTDFGARLKRARKMRQMTQKQLADRLGVEQSAISNYETNFRLPATSALMAIAEVLEVSVFYLLGGDEAIEESPVGEEPKAISHDTSSIQNEFITDVKGKRFERAAEHIKRLEALGVDMVKLYELLFKPTLKAVGEAWASGELSIADEHIISDFIDREMVAFSLRNSKEPASYKPFAAAFMLPGAEMHDFPLKITAEMFKGAGWKTFYIGRSIPLFSLEYFLQNNPVDILVLSVTMKEHLTSCESLIHIVKSMNVLHKPLILVGGSAVDSEKMALEYLQADVYVEDLMGLKKRIDAIEQMGTEE